jgi:uncharacterized Zn-finger protein
MTEHVECPHCGRDNAIESEYIPEEDVYADKTCEYCDKGFEFKSIISITLRAIE